MFFNKIHTIIYIDIASISVFILGTDTAVTKLVLPPNTIKFGKIYDIGALQTSLNSFVVDNNLSGQKAILLLSKDFVFEKKVMLDATSDVAKSELEFLNTLPINQKDIASLILITLDKHTLFVAVDRSLFEPIVTGLEGVIVEKVMAETLFEDFYNNATKSQSYLAEVISAAHALDTASF